MSTLADQQYDIEQPKLIDRHSASQESIIKVLEAVEGDEDGRSQFFWFRLDNGDLILGVYPQGDTYFATEQDHSK